MTGKSRAAERSIEGPEHIRPLSPWTNDGRPIWAISTGCWRTRRKTFCYVTDDEGRVVFQSRQIWPCIGFLDAMEIDVYIIRPDEQLAAGEPPVVVNRKADRQWLRLMDPS